MKRETKIDLKKALLVKNMSEKELAERMGVRQQYLNAISCGKKNVTMKKLESIAEALEMKLHISFE